LRQTDSLENVEDVARVGLHPLLERGHAMGIHKLPSQHDVGLHEAPQGLFVSGGILGQRKIDNLSNAQKDQHHEKNVQSRYLHELIRHAVQRRHNDDPTERW